MAEKNEEKWADRADMAPTPDNAAKSGRMSTLLEYVMNTRRNTYLKRLKKRSRKQ